MLDHVEMMFDKMTEKLQNLKKASYQKNMEAFRQQNGHFLEEMTAYTRQGADREAAAGEVAARFVDAVEGAFAKKGKIKPRTQADLNLFMVYYVFPALLLTGSGEAPLVAERLRETWAARFRNGNIRYETYDEICGAFQEKIMGIF